MPVILTQHYSAADRVYEDAEFSLYHYPRQYFSRIRTYDRFIYYRPLGRSARRHDSKTYFGHGVLGTWTTDARRADHRFVSLIQTEQFPKLVPIYDSFGQFFETESSDAPQFQSAVRDISETAYWKILAAADVKAAGISLLPNTEWIAAQEYAFAVSGIPRDDLRRIEQIPGGAGYRPHGDTRVNVYESAALQERARADHQNVLQHIQREVLKRGGATWYNNNIDLYARIGETRMLVEAKSLTNAAAAVDRMRFGIGQLADYDYRYREKLDGPTKVLAFGAPPDRRTGWIAEILEDQGIGFVVRTERGLLPMNATAEALPIFS